MPTSSIISKDGGLTAAMAAEHETGWPSQRTAITNAGSS